MTPSFLGKEKKCQCLSKYRAFKTKREPKEMIVLPLALIGVAIGMLILTVKIGILLWRNLLRPPPTAKNEPLLLPPSDRQLKLLEGKIVPCDLQEPRCQGFTVCRKLTEPVEIRDSEGTVVRTLQPSEDHNRGYCLPVETSCNPFTGHKILTKFGTKYRYICQCKYPHLVTKRMLMDDCNVVTACGEKGELVPDPTVDVRGERIIKFDPKIDGKCRCPQNQVPDYSEEIGPYCRKRKLHEELAEPCHGGTLTFLAQQCVCPVGYMRADGEELTVHSVFRSNVLSKHSTCIKNPCHWNAYSPDEFLEKSSQVGDNCRCHPRESFAVHSEQSVLTGHYNACMKDGNVLAHSRKMSYQCCFYENEEPDCHWTYQTGGAEFFGSSNVKRIKIRDPWDEKHNFFHRVITDRPRFLKWNEVVKVRVKRDRIKRHLLNFPGRPDVDPFTHDYSLPVLPCAKVYGNYDDTSSNPDVGFGQNLCLYNGGDKTYSNRVIVGPMFAAASGKFCFEVVNSEAILNEINLHGKNDKILHIVSFQEIDRVIKSPKFPFDLVPSYKNN